MGHLFLVVELLNFGDEIVVNLGGLDLLIVELGDTELHILIMLVGFEGVLTIKGPLADVEEY